MKRCFSQLGFTEMPKNPMEVIERAAELMEGHKDSTETDRLARQAIRENRDMCLEAMEMEGQEE